MPEGDTIRYAANRIRPVLEGQMPEEIITPQRRHAMDRWPQKLDGRAVRSVDAHGKHLFLRFEGGLTLHSHLRMTGAWGVAERGARWRRAPRRAWLVLRTPTHEVVEFDGPVLELMTDARTRFDQRISGLGPDVLAEPDFDTAAYPAPAARGRPDPPGRRRPARPADGRRPGEHLAGGGLLGGPDRPLATRSARSPTPRRSSLIDRVRPRMLDSGRHGHRARDTGVYDRRGQPCRRCGTRVLARGMGDDNRTAYWCPGCQR